MSRRFSSYFLIALLLLSTVAIAVPLISTPAVAAGRTAWLKVVTSAWKGTSCGIYDGIDTGFKGDDVGVNTPMCIDPSVSGFADRFNVTGQEAFVEVYGIKPEMGLIQLQGTFEPNATGFVKISWTVEDTWGLLVLVKAKSYYGEKIGAGSPFKGIIMYALAIPPRNMAPEAKEKFLNMSGLYTEWGDGAFDGVGNVTINDDGLIDYHGVYFFDFNLSRAGLGSGPFDILNGTSVDLASFAKIFGNGTSTGTPVNAWIARAAKMFKVFHVHSWYNVKDNLSFAQIKIYDLDHTDPTKESSLIQAAVTGEDGQSRYTREIYPSDALEYRKFWDNHLVPIPLQIFNLKNNTVYHGGIYAPETDEGPIGAPKLNATVRVWWETVIVNQTIYYGWEYNGTGTWTDPDDLGKLGPDFVGPLSMAMNHTVTISYTVTPDGIWVDSDITDNQTNVANIINATVFYARFCVQDADLQIQHPEVGDKLVNMPIAINLKTEGDTPYYLTKNLPTTDNGGCSDDPHKYRGWMSQFSKFSRFPNGTMWYALYVDLDDNGIPDYFDAREIRTFWESFGKHVWLNASLAYLPGDARNYEDIPEGPNLKDVKTPSLIGDEDVKKSDYYDGNWSVLVADVSYANTLTLKDDKPYKGFDVVFKWSGGARNNYPGQEKVVDVLRVENPYSIALLYNYEEEDIFGEWIFPYTPLANNKLIIKVHESDLLELGIEKDGDFTSPEYWARLEDFEGTLEIAGDANLVITDFDRTTGRFDVAITGYLGTSNVLTVNIVENKTDPWVDYWNVTELYIDDCLATIKKHDVLYLGILFIDYQGQVDVEADGRDEYTSVGTVTLSGLGPVEVEIWPVPATGTLRMLISAYGEEVNIDYATIDHFTGALLVKGPPGEIEITPKQLPPPETSYAEEWNFFDVWDNSPPVDNFVFVGKPSNIGPQTEDYIWGDGGGIIRIDPIPNLKIVDMSLDRDVVIYCEFLGDAQVTMKLYKALLRNDVDWFELEGTATYTVSYPDAGFYTYSMIVPLKDDPMDDEYDKWIFGGYDDFALTGTGHVYVTAWVHDIVYYVTDNLGDPLPAGQTEVQLILPNGEVVKRTPAPPELADVMPGSLQWSYKYYGEGNAVFFQLPGSTGPYGVRVLYSGAEVYYERDIIDVLEVTEFVTIVAKVFKVKLVFEDCQGQLMPGLYYKFTLPNGRTDWDRTSREGEVDFPYMAGGTLTIHGVWWKGVELPLMEAKFATGEKIQLVDGKLVLEIGEGIDAPVLVKVPIKDLIFYTTDFQGEIKIPRLNVTLTWMGTPKPWSTEKIYYLETLDPTGDSNTELYNTSIQVHPLWFNYTVKAFFQKIADDSPMDGMTEWEAKYVFYKMPPALYNITVTTVTDEETYGTEPVDGVGGVTPGTSKWPGRTDVETPYEIKIFWPGWAEEYEDTIPEIITGPAEYVNDRVVLRIFGSMGGVPVNTANFPEWLVEAWNPDLIGDRTALVCKEEITLKTWAHDFWKRVIDGDLRIGDAQFKILNDNGAWMIYYDLEEERWVGSVYTSKWTEDIKDISAIMKDSHYTSNIYWNGSYLLTNMYFETNMTYSYSKEENASFIVDKFYNKTAENGVAEFLNFTLVGTENLWKTSSRFVDWTARIEGNTWKDWYPAWFLVYELPKATDVYKVEAGPDGKGVLPIPIPVAFIKLGAFAKDGKTPLANALIELWTLHVDDERKVDIKEQEGKSAFWAEVIGPPEEKREEKCRPSWRWVGVEWEWEKKLKETDEPQVFEKVQWDRIWMRFTTYGIKEHVCVVGPLNIYGINLTNTLRDTRVATVLCEDNVVEVWLHFVGHDTENVTYTVELRVNGDLVDAETQTFRVTHSANFSLGLSNKLLVEVSSTEVSDEEGVWALADVTVSGEYYYMEPTVEVEDWRTIFVQVPPEPAKLILRNVIDDVDVAISQSYIYPLIDSECPVDQNPVVIDEWATPDGLLSYGRWYTDEDGYVDSFKDLGKADPRYGSVVLPIAGWLNATFHDGKVGVWTWTEDVFHYQINVVWKSAVVYSDNFVLDKTGYAIGPTEVYNPTFYMALCNSTDTVVTGLYVTIWYPNVTVWHDEVGWGVPFSPPEDIEELYEDWEALKDVPIYLSANELWATGKKSFSLVPGPRFMNTTWKYTFIANHTKIDWLDNLVHTKLVLNNETFGDDGLRLAGRLSIDVPIMLAAAKEVRFTVLTWRDEAGRLVPYPITDYTVKYEIRRLDAGIVAAKGEGKTDAKGEVVVPSGTTIDKVFWVGMTIRYRVEPPAYTSDYSADFWKKWLEGKEVELVDKKGEYVKPAVEPKMTHAYFPDESPYAYALTEIDTVFAPRADGKFDCVGLCVFNARSKPFLVPVDYTAVTVQVQDFNGRPIEGTLVMLIDKATGKLAAWHYTAGKAWTAKPVDDTYLRKYHVARLVDEDRSFGGAGYTGVMNVSVGPVKYDVDNDDKVDIDLSDRGYVGGRLVTYIVRSFYLPAQEKANDEAMKPVWPYLVGKAQEVYNSERDQVEWKVLLPRALPTGTLYIPADMAPTGSLVKEHADVRAAIFDAKIRFGYEGKTLTDEVKRDLKIVVEAKEIGFKAEFSGRDTVSLLMLPRGTYTIEAAWKGETVARKTFDLSNVNVGTVTMDVDLGLTDAIFAVKDLSGRAVPVARDKVSVENGPYASISVKDNKVNVVAMVKSKTYTVSVGYAAYGKATTATYVGLPEGLKELILPVGDIAITVVDVEGRPVGGATVKLEGVAETKTDSQGRAIFQMLPLEDETGAPIKYGVTVTREKTVTASITTSRSSTEFRILYGLGSIKVIVRGAAGQSLAGARVDLLSGGALVGTAVTDEKGEATFTGLAEGTYTVRVDWKTFKDEKSVTLTESDIMAKVPKTVEFALPPFTEIAGVPLDFGTFVALIVGIILLVIVLAIIISEYVRWRGRRLGIYPPPPPKK